MPWGISDGNDEDSIIGVSDGNDDDSNVEMSKAPYGPTELCQELMIIIDQKASIYCDCQEVKDGIMIGNNSFI